MKISRAIKTILESKLSFLGGAIIGSIIGLIWPESGELLGHVGEIFIDILKMCILPIVVTSISLSIAHYMLSKAEQSLTKIALVLTCAFLTVSVIGSGTALLLQPGYNINPAASETLKEHLDHAAESTKSIDAPIEVRLSKGFMEMLFKAFPSNIFVAFTTNNLLQIVVFSLIFGVALGRFSEYDAHIMHLTRQISEIFINIFEVIIQIFPIVLIFLIAKEVSVIGPDLFIAMGNFIIKIYVAYLILLLISTIVIKFRTKTSFYQSIKVLLDPMLIAFVTRNSNAAIPSSILAMRRFQYDPNLTKLLIPLGTILGRFGYVLFFGFCTVFAMQLYNIEIGFNEYILLVLITVIAALSTTGQEESTLALSSLAVVLTPVGIPLAGILPLLFAIDIFIDPFRAMATVQTNCATVALIGNPQGEIISLEEAEKRQMSEAIKE